MNDVKLALIFFVLLGIGFCDLSKNTNLRPASKPICSIEFRGVNSDCIQVRKEEIGDIEGL